MKAEHLPFVIPFSGPLQSTDPILIPPPVVPEFRIAIPLLDYDLKVPVWPVVPILYFPAMDEYKPPTVVIQVDNSPPMIVPLVPVYPTTPRPPIVRPPCQANTSGCN